MSLLQKTAYRTNQVRDVVVNQAKAVTHRLLPEQAIPYVPAGVSLPASDTPTFHIH
jgi:hypothetical protein